MSHEFSECVQRQLEEWLDGSKHFKRLYDADKDGCNPEVFHKKCDNKGPTVTVIYNPHGAMYGGYTSMSWQTHGGSYIVDSSAFLFSIFDNNKWKPQRFIITKSANAIYTREGYGPIFGSGHDINIMSGPLTKEGGVYKMAGISLGNSYNMMGSTNIHNGSNDFTNFQVYSVTDGPRELEKSWRPTEEWNKNFLEQLKDDVSGFVPLPEIDVPQARILLLGPVGAGKSSFFNTINSVFRGYVTSQACSGSSEHSLTTRFRMYQIRANASEKPLNFRLCDTRGLEEGQGLDSHEINFFLDGHVPDGYQFNPSISISKEMPGFICKSELKNKIHCACFVIDGSTVDVLPAKMMEKMKSLQSQMNIRGIPQVVLLTKIDKVCALVNEDTSVVFKSEAIFSLVDKVSQLLGLPRSHVLPVKNYERELDLSGDVSILSLLAMRQILRYSLDYMFNFLDHYNCVDEMNVKD